MHFNGIEMKAVIESGVVCIGIKKNSDLSPHKLFQIII